MAEDSNPLNYVNYNFEDLVIQLQNRVKLRDEWKDTYRSSTGQMLLELYGYVGNLVLYYIERRANESYLDTAQNRSSVLNLVKLINYKPKRNVSAVGVLKFTLSAPATKRVFVPKYTEVESNTGIKYLVSDDVVINIGQTFVEAAGIQGEIKEISTTSSGGPNQEYKIDDAEVENSNVFVLIDSETWTPVESFFTSQNADKHYVVRYEVDDTVAIRFGNDIFGKAPTSGSRILIRYVKSAGSNGNVFQNELITKLNSTLFDEDGVAVASVAVSNSDLFLGGDDVEATEEIKNEAPRVFATGDRAVTKNDYIAIIENFAGVANTNVWGENEEDPPNPDMFNRVKLVVLLQDWQHPSATFKQELTDFLYTKSMITVRYSFVEADILMVIPVLTIRAIKGSQLSQVQSDTEDALNSAFVLGTTTLIGTAKRHSDLVETVENVAGVSFLYLTLEVRKSLTAFYDSYGEFGVTLTALPLKPTTIRLFADDVQVAVDDGIGGWTSLTSDYLVTGDIDYTTGLIHASFAPDAASDAEVYVRYQPNQNGDIVTKRDQICRLLSVDVTNIQYES